MTATEKDVHLHEMGTDTCTYERLGGGRVRCLTCAHECVIGPGKTGVCGLRRNEDGALRLRVYGRLCSANSRDPIEKKPLYHVLPGARTFSIATVGCNFRCSFCQNWDISQGLRRPDQTAEDIEGLAGMASEYVSPEDVVRSAVEGGCRAMAYTYTEPTVFLEFAEDCAAEAKGKGLRNVFKTNGYESALTVSRMTGIIDAANVDLKSFSDDWYRKVCGARLAPVLDTIRNLHSAGIWTEVTTLVIPGENDSDDELGQIARFLAGVSKDIPWHVTPFHPDFKMADGKSRTPESTLERAYAIGKRAGLNFVYARSEEHSSTYCPGCGKTLIRRSGFSSSVVASNFSLTTGKCLSCGTAIPGVWS